MPPISAPRGTRDLLPADAAAWEWLHTTHHDVAGAHGYRLVDTPAFEATEMFERGVGAGTDVVDKEMYTFIDRGGRSLTLRPEATPGIVRAVLAAGLGAETRPVRVHFAGPMFRYDRPQAGRYRQFHQVDIECIGERSPHLDVEVIEVAWCFYAALGLEGVVLKLNSLGDIEDRNRYRAALVEHFRPQRDQLCADCRRRLDINPLRLLDCKADAGLVSQAPIITGYLSDTSSNFFEAVSGGLRAAGIPFDIAPRLVRGLDYYAHTAFEFWHVSLDGAQNALGGGGRYDGLAEVLGFPPTPGVGYGLGVERALLVAAQAGLAPPPAAAAAVLVCSVTPAQATAAASVARTIRTAGISAVLDVSDRKLDRKLRAVGRLGVCAAVIVGEDEVADDAGMLRNLRTREQSVTPVSALPAAISAIIAGGPQP